MLFLFSFLHEKENSSWLVLTTKVSLFLFSVVGEEKMTITTDINSE